MAGLCPSVAGIIGPGARAQPCAAVPLSPPILPSTCHCNRHTSRPAELPACSPQAVPGCHLLAGADVNEFKTTASHSWLCGTMSLLSGRRLTACSPVEPMFFMLWVQPHGVKSKLEPWEVGHAGGAAASPLASGQSLQQLFLGGWDSYQE